MTKESCTHPSNNFIKQTYSNLVANKTAHSSMTIQVNKTNNALNFEAASNPISFEQHSSNSDIQQTNNIITSYN